MLPNDLKIALAKLFKRAAGTRPLTSSPGTEIFPRALCTPLRDHHHQMQVRRTPALILVLPDTDNLATPGIPICDTKTIDRGLVLFHSRKQLLPLAGNRQGEHARLAATLKQRTVIKLTESPNHTGTRLPRETTDRAALLTRHTRMNTFEIGHPLRVTVRN